MSKLPAPENEFAVRQRPARGWTYVRHTYQTHRDFCLLLGLFAFLQFMLLAFFSAGGRFHDYSDYWYYYEMASRLDSGYYPYIHYWVEYPPLFPWLPVGAYWLSRLLPPASDPQLWFDVVYGALMGLFGVGNLAMVYLLGLLLPAGSPLSNRPRALRCACLYALLFGPIFVHAGWFDGVALFFMLLSLYLLLKNRGALSGLAAGAGAMIKVLPVALAPVGFKLLPERWRYIASLGGTMIAINLPFILLNPVMFVASWRALLMVPSWESVWALLDGYYSYGLALGNRFDPAQAGIEQRPEFVPWSAVLIVFGLVYLLVYLLPWQQRQADRQTASGKLCLRGQPVWRFVLDQFRHPVLGQGDGAVDRMGVVAFVALSLNLFMIFSRGWSPQFVLWYLPFLVLTMPNGWGLAYATLLTANSVIERILYFLVVPESHWLLVGTVLTRTVLMLILVPEYLAVMGLLPAAPWRRLRRWLAIPAVLITLLLVGLGTMAFVRDYSQQRYAASPQRHVVDRIRTIALPGDGIVVTNREPFDAMAPFLPDQEVRLYSRVDGEFRQDAFEDRWAEFVTNHPRIWLLLDYAGGQNADWNTYLVALLDQDGYQTTDEWVGPEQRLVHYATMAPTIVRTEEVDATFGDNVRLVRLVLDGQPLHGGEVLRLQLLWQPSPAGATWESGSQYKVFVHLVSAQGQLAAQRDLALSDLEGQAARVGLALPPDLAPGTYQLRIGVYDAATGERLSVQLPDGRSASGQDNLLIEEIQVR